MQARQSKWTAWKKADTIIFWSRLPHHLHLGNTWGGTSHPTSWAWPNMIATSHDKLILEVFVCGRIRTGYELITKKLDIAPTVFGMWQGRPFGTQPPNSKEEKPPLWSGGWTTRPWRRDEWTHQFVHHVLLKSNVGGGDWFALIEGPWHSYKDVQSNSWKVSNSCLIGLFRKFCCHIGWQV